MRSAILTTLLLSIIGSSLAVSYPLFKQCDPRWGNDELGAGNSICKVGCLMSSMSMALAGLGKSINGQPSNPKTLNAWLRSNGGYIRDDFIWASVNRLGVQYQGKVADTNTIRNAVNAPNRFVILSVRNGGHYVLATGLNGSGYNVNDPGANRATYANNEVNQAAIYAY